MCRPSTASPGVARKPAGKTRFVAAFVLATRGSVHSHREDQGRCACCNFLQEGVYIGRVHKDGFMSKVGRNVMHASDEGMMLRDRVFHHISWRVSVW